MKINKLAMAFLSICIFTHCGKKSDLKFSANSLSNQSLAPDEEVTFTKIKSEILTPYCLSCHSSVGLESNLKKWITPGYPDQSPFFTTVENASMPKNQKPLSTRGLELIRVYISQMLPATAGSTSGGSTSGASNAGITFTQIKNTILNPYRCLNCHSVGTEEKLLKWINKTSPEKSSFYTTMRSGSMPQGGPRATTETLAYVLQYIKDFARR